MVNSFKGRLLVMRTSTRFHNRAGGPYMLAIDRVAFALKKRAAIYA